jgi:outer membrane lipoprotein-sorting protein
MAICGRRMASGQTPSAENCLEFMLEFANKEAPKVSKDSRIVIPRYAIPLHWQALPRLRVREEAYFMKRFVWFAVTMIALLPVCVQAQTVDEIIAKNVQARGGLEKIRAIKTVRMTAKFSQDSFRAKFVQENKRDDKVREEVIIQGMAQVQAYDGHAAWQINPFGGRKDPELMSQDDSKSLILDADLEGPLVDYKQKGHRAELVGHDAVEGTDCYKIKLNLNNGDVRYYYLDADSYLEIKFETQTNVRGSVQYNDTLLGDYEQVDGVYFPFSIESAETGTENWARFTVEKMELNVPLEDSLFSVPAGKTEVKSAAAAK